MKLLIVESPAKIKTISKFLGSSFKIMSTFGHIKDLPARKLGINRDAQGSISLDYVVIEDKEDIISAICKQASSCSEVYLASDPDREGEIISWHIGQEIAKVMSNKKNIFRISFNEITEPAINAAIDEKGSINMDVVNAQQARRILDRWVGYEVSPILWKKIAKGLSAGRVQSVALLLICQRDEEITQFKPEESWSVHAIFTVAKNAELQAELSKIKKKTFKLKNKEEADKILADINKESYTVTQITEKKRAKNPSAPFMTSTLQQDAYNKLGFSVDKTMSVAQKLYEGVPLLDKNQPEALITYMRTDSLRISDTALKAARSFIKDEYGTKFCPKSANVYGKGAQDAHEAIRPIDVTKTPQMVGKFLKPEQAKLYELIWKRFVASQMTPAEYFQRQVLIDGGPFTFKATGSTLVFEGFLKVYLEEDEETDQAVKIPKEVKEACPLDIKNLNNKQHFTQPPARYTEATLVKELEKQGIGRPSTYATILTTIEKRSYVARDNKRFVPTELGKAVSNMLAKNLPDIINITFTAKMEEDLDKIAQGEIDRDAVLNNFYTQFKKDLVAFGGTEVSQKAIETSLTCPECEKPLVVRYGKSGQFAGCTGFPTCKFTSAVNRGEDGEFTLVQEDPATQAEMSDLTCPQCGKQLVKKMGKFGAFFSCPGYPDCKYIHQDKLKTPCPQCNSALTKRRWRGGSFWGCEKYPECKFAIFGQVTETPCPLCKSPYLLVAKDKEGNEKHSCPNKACTYKVTPEKE